MIDCFLLSVSIGALHTKQVSNVERALVARARDVAKLPLRSHLNSTMRRKDAHALRERDHSVRIDWAVRVFEVGDAVAQTERSLGVVTITSKDDLLGARRIVTLSKLEPDFVHDTSNLGSPLQKNVWQA